jgi:flavorubredoxin
MDMKALDLQKRTFAVMENGSWAPKAGDLIYEFLDKELKEITILDDRVTINSARSELNDSEMESLADALAESIKAE